LYFTLCILKKLLIYSVYFILTCQTLVVGQSKNDLKKLNTLFWSGNYREVILNYAELYNQDRKNEDINFKYGTCLLFESDSISKQEKAIGHLRFACAKEGSLAEYHFFLGRALHRFGDFEGALNHFALYKTKKNKTSVELNAELYINYCTESLKLNELTQASLIKIGSIVPTQLGKSYSLNQIELTGKFFNSIEFQTKLDKKKNYEPLIFKSDNATMRFFASYGEKDEENKDIYLVTGSFDNKKIERLSSKINTRFDEDYPIFDEKTNYLYFSSLGHNSSGGYDIFRSKYDSLSQEFETPENLGKGISTPYDDFLFMYNPLNNRAFISSTKLSLSGGISIFQGVVNFTDYSIQLPVTVNIQFKNGDNNSMKLKSIQIKNLANDSIIQTLNPVASNNFEMKLSPGTYSYTIQISGSKDIFEAKIDIPNDQQKIIQTVEYSLNDLNTEIVAITNIIENVSSEVVLALNKTKEGKSNIQSSKLLDEQNEKEVLEKLGMESFSKIEVIDAISDKIIELELAQKENLDLINKLNAAIVHNKSYYQQLQHEIDSINPSLSDFTNIEKLEKLKYIENISAEQAEVAKQTIWLQQLNDSIRNTQKLNETNYRLVQKLGEEIIDLTQQENQIEAYQKIIQNHQQYLALNAETAFETIYNDLLNIELELSRIDKKVIVLMNEKTKFQDELTETEIKLRNVTNKERTELEKSKMNFEQKLASNEKQITRLKLDKSELIILKTDKELKRNILAAVIKEDYEEPTNYEDAVKNYFDSKLNQDSKSEEIAQKIKQIEENLTPEEIAYSKASKLYAIKIESLYNSDNDKTQKIAIEQEYSNTLKQLIEKGEDSASFISFLNEKLQESTSKLQAMKLDEKQQEDNNQIAKSNGKQADPGEVIEKESISENQIAKSDGKQANPTEVIEKESVTENQIVKSDGKQANPTEVIEKESITENQIAKSDGKQANPTEVIEKESISENQIAKSDGKQANPAEVIEKESVTENQIVKSDGKQANPTEVIEKGSVTENQIAKSDGKQANPTEEIDKESVTENQIVKSDGKQANPTEVIEKESVTENQIVKSDDKQANPTEVIEKESITENQIAKSDGKQANPTEVIEKESVTENQIAKSDGKQTNPDVVIEKEIVTENQIVKSVLSEKLPQNLESLVGQDVNDLSKNLKEIETQKSVIYTELQTNNPTISFLSIEKLRYNLEILQDRNSIITQLLEEEKVKVDQSKNKKEKSILNTKITELDIELTENTNLINQIKQEIEKEGEIQITLEKKSTINYLEEKKQLEITASQSYKNFVIALVDFEKTETKFEKTKDTINQIKAAIDREINNIVTNPNNVTHKKNVELLTIALQKQLKEKKNLTSGMLEQKNEILNIESGNKEIINEMRFLVVNKTEPLVKTISTPKNENIPLTGFDINQKKESNYNSSNPIPLNVKAPKGLVYRVQVGAFRKPIPQNLYSSFNPVSGELSPNGLTLYMAGYFNNAKNAVTARKQIQQLGYSDAFVVAYCDGEKITLGEARILESKGECIPLNSTNFILEIANNTKEALKEQKSIETKPSNQNTTSNEPLLQASQKLFYTVQIAVYNQLINEKVKFPALNEIATTKISTGQIRYSTGRFSDLNSAKERKDKAIQSGIKDAFIVAYFKGDRITIAAAKDLLSQYGDSILFSNPTQEVFHSEELAYQSSDKKYFAQDEVKATPIYHRYQSNDEFERFPIEKLAYFNQYGLFQYNPDSKKIESLSFKIENDLESSLKLSGYLSSLTYNPTYFSTDINESISGDLADFILRSHSIQRINSKENLQIEFEKSLILKENYTNLLKDTFQLNIKPHE